jgi:hypothetical protein
MRFFLYFPNFYHRPLAASHGLVGGPAHYVAAPHCVRWGHVAALHFLLYKEIRKVGKQDFLKNLII